MHFVGGERSYCQKSTESLDQSYGGCWVLELHKSFQVLLSYNNDNLFPLKFAFFEEIAHKLNKFLRRFRIYPPMTPFLADKIEDILRWLCNPFILNNIMDGIVKTRDLIKIDILGDYFRWYHQIWYAETKCPSWFFDPQRHQSVLKEW